MLSFGSDKKSKSSFGIPIAGCAIIGIIILFLSALGLIFGGLGGEGPEISGEIKCENIPEPQLIILTKASQKWQVKVELLAAIGQKESSFITGDINRNWNTEVNQQGSEDHKGPFQFADTTWQSQIDTAHKPPHSSLLDAGGDSYEQDSTGAPDGDENIFSPWDSAYGAAFMFAMNDVDGNITPDTTVGLKKIKDAVSKFRKGAGWDEGGKDDPVVVKYVDDVLQLYSQYKCTYGDYGDGDFTNPAYTDCQNKIINRAVFYYNDSQRNSSKYEYNQNKRTQHQPNNNPKYFDCSSLVSKIYQEAALFRNQYATTGSIRDNPSNYKLKKNSFDDRLAGDIIVHYSSRSNTGRHTGIYVGKNKYIHIPGTGRKISLSRIPAENAIIGFYRSEKCPASKPQPTSSTTNFSGRTVVIDPGHGTASNKRANEDIPNWQVSLKLQSALQNKGFKVYLTHAGPIKREKLGNNEVEDNITRAKRANAKNPLLTISIHGDQPNGVALIYYPYDPINNIAKSSKMAAETVWSNYKNIPPISESKKKGAKSEDSFDNPTTQENKKEHGRAVLTKSLYIDHPIITIEMINLDTQGINWISQEQNQQKIAQAIANGIEQYYQNNVK
ncbi:MAG: hypothetical protein CEN89_47 [Candidatus Berkelbacteria bacterium Licking1014_7]|uniref:NlpC/P60 domain-containing protein n=1 Tax=Candidatus Berkelbacteria bacterium Licking1014_7 TaxID=2017147 RepID=A0A554LKW0_9BACT|nr:MAG: hypothetical protein CEN89_47 [Candidatus Berkelbacteria bacterium Licking1014_7]